MTMKNILHILLDANSLTSKFLCVIIYIFIYDYIYEEYIYEIFGYMGSVDYIPMSLPERFSWILLSLLPIMFYHRIEEISTFLSLFIYIFVYIFLVIELITLVLTLLFVAMRAGSMHFVNIFTQIDMLYELREQNSGQVEERSLILYVQGWLSGAFFPFLLVWYLKYKSYIKSGLVLFGYLLLFMVDMQKITFLLPVILIMFFYLIKWKEETICNRLHSIMFWALIIFSSLLMAVSDSDNKVLFAIVSIVLLRTVCVTGWLTQMYLHFFQENPFTYYTHINIVNAITNAYPYDVPLGMAVAYNSQNANATFFLTEGIASWGIIGVAITGGIFLFILYLINSITSKYHKSDIFVLFIPSLASMLNASIFSTLLTGGLFILIILLAWCNPMGELKTA